MNTVQVKDKQFSLYITEEEIKARIKEMAGKISADLKDKHPLFLVILKGAFIFAADLLRHLDFPCEITFVRVSSYEGTTTTGNVKQLLGIEESIEGRTVVIVEDIIESGYTLQEVLRILDKKHPAKVLISSLFIKPECLKAPIHVDYPCFEISNEFIVGYGLDYNEEGRNLNAIYQLK